ncbi:MAG: hypothetical protein JW832_04825, partial [Deltaproteobacteria bacterium]|nr:hypothetical protein [Deltaproteobacteria bacterium]
MNGLDMGSKICMLCWEEMEAIDLNFKKIINFYGIEFYSIIITKDNIETKFLNNFFKNNKFCVVVSGVTISKIIIFNKLKYDF